MIERLLQRRIEAISSSLRDRLTQLPVAQLENLAEALLNFSSEGDLAAWLQNH